jgi:hypothetical protein
MFVDCRPIAAHKCSSLECLPQLFAIIAKAREIDAVNHDNDIIQATTKNKSYVYPVCLRVKRPFSK